MGKESLRYFAELLADAMARKGMNGKEVAREMGVTGTTVSVWLNPHSFKDLPDYEKLPKLAAFLGVDPRDLFIRKVEIKLGSPLDPPGAQSTSPLEQRVLGMIRDGDWRGLHDLAFIQHTSPGAGRVAIDEPDDPPLPRPRRRGARTAPYILADHADPKKGGKQ